MSGLSTMWIGLALIGAGAIIAVVMIGLKIRSDLAKDAVEFTDPKSPATLEVERLAAIQAQIERDRKPASHRNMEDVTHPIVRDLVAKARDDQVNTERNYKHEPHWYDGRPRESTGVW